MAEGNGGRGTGLRRLVGRWIKRVAEVLPTVRSRLFALVGLTLVPALVILAYDEWQARQRGLGAFADVSTRVVRLMRLDLDGRIPAPAGGSRPWPPTPRSCRWGRSQGDDSSTRFGTTACTTT